MSAARLASPGLSRMVCFTCIRFVFPFFRYLAQQLACPPLVWRPHVSGIFGLSRAVCFTCNAMVVSCLATLPSCSRVSCSLSVHWIIEDGCFTCHGVVFCFLGASRSSSRASCSFSIHWCIEAGCFTCNGFVFPFVRYPAQQLACQLLV